MDLPAQMALFARVVDAGSISAAARRMNQSPSAVSKQVSHLENRLSTRLLNRSKVGIALTEEGRIFHEHCARIAWEVDEAQELMQSLGDHPSGTLRLTATVAFGKAQVLPVLPGFMEQYPDVEISALFTDQKVDLARDRIDVAVWIREQIIDEDLVARKLANNARILCASPYYIEKHGMPETFADLSNHNCLKLDGISGWNEWHFDTEGASPEVSGNFTANSADAIYHATLAGIGIARLSHYIVGRDIRDGRLVRLLPSYEENFSSIHAVYTAGRHLSPKVRAFIDYLVATFAQKPPWEDAL